MQNFEIELVRTSTVQIFRRTCPKTSGVGMSEVIYLLDQIDFMMITNGIGSVRADFSRINIQRESGRYVFDIIADDERLHITAKETA